MIYIGSDGRVIRTAGAMIVVRDKRTAARKQRPVADHRYIREAP